MKEIKATRESYRVFSNKAAFEWLLEQFPDGQIEYDADNDILIAYIMVDDGDYETMKDHKWYLKIDNANDPDKRHVSIGRRPIVSDPKWYKPSSLVLATRHILGLHLKGLVIKHYDGNLLNCQLHNIHTATTINGVMLKRMRDHWLDNAKISAGLPA
ncbi:MAG: hypothetical protein ACXABD_22160 [Candidatus Thorarchaeota archaeon]|jgi:hypothetical protein